MKKITYLLIVLVLFFVVGCAPEATPSAEAAAAFDIVGEWEYDDEIGR